MIFHARNFYRAKLFQVIGDKLRVQQGKASQTSVSEIDAIVNKILQDARSVARSIEQLAADTHI